MPAEPNMSKRQMLREKRQREQQRSRLIAIAVMVVGALLIAWFMIVSIKPPKDPVIPAAFERPNVVENSTGDANAPLTLTEYSDFQCPYCKRFADETERQLVEAYVATGKLRFVYRSFGMFIGQESQASAEAAYCAGDQGKFWEYHDILFANHTGENVGDYANKNLQAFAKALNLDMTAFDSCLNSGKYSGRVTQDGIDGQNAGIKATPSFVLSWVVNGETKTKLIEGAMPFSEFQKEIEAALLEVGK